MVMLLIAFVEDWHLYRLTTLYGLLGALGQRPLRLKQ